LQKDGEVSEENKQRISAEDAERFNAYKEKFIK